LQRRPVHPGLLYFPLAKAHLASSLKHPAPIKLFGATWLPGFYQKNPLKTASIGRSLHCCAATNISAFPIAIIKLQSILVTKQYCLC
jgi:hypothetical protein